MKNVRRIIILYPGELNPERISEPGNYSLSRLLLLIRQNQEVPVRLFNQSKGRRKFGVIDFVHLSRSALLKEALRCLFTGNVLIINQLHSYRRYAVLLRSLLPNSRLLVRTGGVYHGKDYIRSSRFDRLLESELKYLKKADMIISTADGTPVDLYMERAGIPKDRYKRWLNGFPVIENRNNYQRRNEIVCISRLSPVKGIDYVLKSYAFALPRLRAYHKLIVVGDGPELANLNRQCTELGISSHVDFVGHSSDIEKFLYSSKLLVSGLGNNTIMEAIATRTPVVAVDLGETRELYGHFSNVRVVDYAPGGYGRIHPDRMDALCRDTADAICEILNDYPIINEDASTFTRDLFSWDERLQLELELYDSLFDHPVR